MVRMRGLGGEVGAVWRGRRASSVSKMTLTSRTVPSSISSAAVAASSARFCSPSCSSSTSVCRMAARDSRRYCSSAAAASFAACGMRRVRCARSCGTDGACGRGGACCGADGGAVRCGPVQCDGPARQWLHLGFSPCGRLHVHLLQDSNDALAHLIALLLPSVQLDRLLPDHCLRVCDFIRARGQSILESLKLPRLRLLRGAGQSCEARVQVEQCRGGGGIPAAAPHSWPPVSGRPAWRPNGRQCGWWAFWAMFRAWWPGGGKHGRGSIRPRREICWFERTSMWNQQN